MSQTEYKADQDIIDKQQDEVIANCWELLNVMERIESTGRIESDANTKKYRFNLFNHRLRLALELLEIEKKGTIIFQHAKKIDIIEMLEGLNKKYSEEKIRLQKEYELATNTEIQKQLELIANYFNQPVFSDVINGMEQENARVIGVAMATLIVHIDTLNEIKGSIDRSIEAVKEKINDTYKGADIDEEFKDPDGFLDLTKHVKIMSKFNKDKNKEDKYRRAAELSALGQILRRTSTQIDLHKNIEKDLLDTVRKQAPKDSFAVAEEEVQRQKLSEAQVSEYGAALRELKVVVKEIENNIRIFKAQMIGSTNTQQAIGFGELVESEKLKLRGTLENARSKLAGLAAYGLDVSKVWSELEKGPGEIAKIEDQLQKAIAFADKSKSEPADPANPADPKPKQSPQVPPSISFSGGQRTGKFPATANGPDVSNNQQSTLPQSRPPLNRGPFFS